MSLPSSRLASYRPTAGIEAFLLGAFLTITLVSILSAWALGTVYSPTVENAQASLVYAETTNPWWGVVRGIVHFGQSGIVVSGAALLLVRFFARSFGKGRNLNWVLLILALAAFLKWSFAGQALAWDQWAYHGTLVRLGIVESFPIVGPIMHDWMAPNGVDQTTLTILNLLYHGAYPAFLLVFCWGLFRTREKGHGKAGGLGGLIGVGFVFLGAWFLTDAYALDIAARPDRALPDVRPEWFFVPISKLLNLLDGSQTGMVLIGLEALLLLLLIWPFIQGRWTWVLDRLVASLFVLALVGLYAWALGTDFRHQKGSFAKPDIESIMGDLGQINKSLGQGGEAIAADDPWALVADLIVLSKQTRRAARLPEFAPKRDKWLEWSDAMLADAGKFWQTRDRKGLEKLRDSMRESCQSCHEAFEVDVNLLMPEKKAEVATIWRFHASLKSGVEADDYSSVSTVKRLMKKSRKSYNALNKGDAKLSWKAVVDLIAQYERMKPLLHEDWDDEAEAGTVERWNADCDQVIRILRKLSQTSDEAAYREQLANLRIACESCHSAYDLDDEEGWEELDMVVMPESAK